MLDLGLDRKNIKPDYIKTAKGEKLYFSSAIPAKMILSLQGEAIGLGSESSDPKEIKEKYNEMMSILKEMFYLHNDINLTDKVIDGLTIDDITTVIKYVFKQIGNTAKKKLNGIKRKTS